MLYLSKYIHVRECGMYISDLFNQKKVVFSFEIFPPKIESPIDSIYPALESLSGLKPDFISVTFSAGGSKGGRTAEIAALVKDKYNIPPLAHLTCIGSDRRTVELELDKLKAHGIKNILALRGDKRPDIPPSKDFLHASDLIEFIAKRGGFDISAACYPEGHTESDSLKKDVEFLKRKTDCGANHLITQLFFDNEDFYKFKELTDRAGISAPIQTGIMPLIKKQQVERMLTLTGVKIPAKLSRIMAKFADNPESLMEAGIAYATDQIVDLLSAGVRGVHLYVMNNRYVAEKIYNNIKDILKSLNE